MPPLTELLLVRIDLTNEGPVFSTFPSYTIPGQAQNVFILDAPRRYLAAYVCIIETDCIGLFCQLDWSKDEYIFIDTNIPYVTLSHHIQSALTYHSTPGIPSELDMYPTRRRDRRTL